MNSEDLGVFAAVLDKRLDGVNAANGDAKKVNATITTRNL
jgi:hypothetical protein